jgi:hypothetical protein
MYFSNMALATRRMYFGISAAEFRRGGGQADSNRDFAGDIRK